MPRLTHPTTTSTNRLVDELTDDACAVSQAPEPAPGSIPYKVTVFTSDVSGGAFDGLVWVTLNGPLGGYASSGELLLPSNEYK